MRFDGTLTRIRRDLRRAETAYLDLAAQNRREGFYRGLALGFVLGWLVTALVAGLLFFIERR